MLVLNIITSCNLLVLFALLYFRKDTALPNKILALILINPAINFLSNVTILTGNLSTLPYIYFFAQITCFLFAPLVYIYVQLMIGEKLNLRHPLYVMTLGGMLFAFACLLQFAFILSPVEKETYLSGILNEPYPAQMVWSNSLFILMQQIYFTVSAIQIYQYRKKLFNTLSSHENTKVIYITRFIQLIWLLNITTIILYATLPTTQVEYVILPLVLTFIYFFILYFSFHHNSIFTGESYREFLLNNKPAQKELQVSDTATPASPSENAPDHLALDINLYLSSTLAFTRPDITLNSLAEGMNLSAAKISLVINKKLGKTFFELINEKRIERSQELLQLRKDLTIEGIAYESGFNSRAAFYRAFKKHTGLTPSEYLAQQSALQA